MLESLAEHFDEPFGDPSAIPMLYLARMTRQHVTVALSGTARTKLFGGYRRYYYGVLEEKLRRKFPGWFRRWVVAGRPHYPKFDYLPQVFRAKTLLTNCRPGNRRRLLHQHDRVSRRRPGRRAGPRRCAARQRLRATERFREPLHRRAPLHPLEQMQAVDFRPTCRATSW